MIVEGASKVTLKYNMKKKKVRHIICTWYLFFCLPLLSWTCVLEKHVVKATDMLDFLKKIMESVGSIGRQDH